MIFNQDAKTLNGEGQCIEQWYWDNWTPTSKRTKFNHYTMYKKNPNWIKNLNITVKTIKLLG